MFTAADAKFALFKIEVTNADGTTNVMTLAQAGITAINLKADLTNVQYADGSAITGQTTFTRSNGSVGDSYDNALAETINGLYKAEVIHRRPSWRSFEDVEEALLRHADIPAMAA